MIIFIKTAKAIGRYYMPIKDKTTPQSRKRFLEEIKHSKETGKERGFHICIEDNGKLSAGDTCIGV